MSEAGTILVTGASRGIGAELVHRFAAQGHKVILNYHRSEHEAEELAAAINAQSRPGRAVAVRADVSKRSDVSVLFDEAERRLGPVEVLIGCAGQNIDRPFLEMTETEWEDVVGTILKGTFLCSQEFARRYRGSRGHIITIGALTAFRGRKNGANYCPARAGVVNLTKCMAQELAPDIRVNCVVPGWIDTDEVRTRYDLAKPENLARALATVPLGRLGTPSDVFTMIDFIINRSTYQTGQSFFVDGGYLMY